MNLTSADVQRSFHYLYPAELPALKVLVAELPENPIVVNIGAGAGTSGLAILETRPDVMLVTVDIQDESSPFGCLAGERDVIQRAGFGDEWNKRWFQIRGDSVTVGQNWSTGFGQYEDGEERASLYFVRPISMVFIDGDHSYEGCKGDIEAWLPHIVDGGILAVHDYLKENLQADPDGPHPMPWPGVDSAVNELLMPNFDVILHVASLIVFRVRHA